MATATDARARGFSLPAGSDLVSGGDNAITTNAITTTTYLDGVDARMGRRIAALDTDGRPYLVPDGNGSHVILTDSDGPYVSPALARSVTVSDGVPVLT